MKRGGPDGNPPEPPKTLTEPFENEVGSVRDTQEGTKHVQEDDAARHDGDGSNGALRVKRERHLGQLAPRRGSARGKREYPRHIRCQRDRSRRWKARIQLDKRQRWG